MNDPETGLFKGPWVQLRRPFRPAEADETVSFEFAVPFHPFKHQNRAWRRLSSQDQAPRSAIVTTGTGSGKTECLGSDYRERWRRFLSVLNLLQFWGNFRFWTSSEADDEAPEIPLEAATALAEAWQAVLDEVVPSLQPYIHELAAAGLPVPESLAEVEHFNDHVPQSAWSNQASDGYRAIVIVPEKGDTYILVHIDSYDRAYQWARHKRFEAHQMIGNGYPVATRLTRWKKVASCDKLFLMRSR